MQTLKVGFIGAGFISGFQSVGMKMIRNVELQGVYSLKGSEKLARYAHENNLGPCNIYSSVAELCENCEAIAIFAPNPFRVELVEEVVKAVNKGAELKGIICEKPLGRTVAEAEKLVSLARGADLRTAYFENQIFMKSIQNALTQLRPQQEAIGPLILARCAEEHAGPHEPWFWDPVRQGGGVLSDMGCHSIATGQYVLTPPGKGLDFLEPVSVSAEISLLKWGLPAMREKLLKKTGVDYSKTPAEDFATGTITFRNPETNQKVKAQFSNSWMYDKLGLRLLMEGLGPDYTFEINSLRSPLEIFIGDQAAQAIADSEAAVEKATASRGLMCIQPNEADLYGYADELKDATDSFLAGADGYLNWEYGLEITRLVQAAYLSAETKRHVDLTDPGTQEKLRSFVPLVAQGKGAEMLL